ncbi:MAG TPA: hypothetical protein VIQ99_01205, partial [Gammaproteobacteria bacterium]
IRSIGTAFAVTVLLAAATSFAQENRTGTTRLLVTHVRVPPARVATWLELQRNEVIPALKKAGLENYTTYQTVVGEVTEFVIVRPFAFAELDAQDALDRALGANAAAALRAKLRDCTESMHRSIENRHDDLFLDPGAAAVLFVSRYRAMPGRARDYMSFVRSEMYPVMKQAQEEGTFAGLSVTTSVQGGEPGIITLNMHYETFAPLDGPPPVAKTLGPQGTAAFLAKGAGLIEQVDQSILRRIADLSF